MPYYDATQSPFFTQPGKNTPPGTVPSIPGPGGGGGGGAVGAGGGAPGKGGMPQQTQGTPPGKGGMPPSNAGMPQAPPSMPGKGGMPGHANMRGQMTGGMPPQNLTRSAGSNSTGGFNTGTSNMPNFNGVVNPTAMYMNQRGLGNGIVNGGMGPNALSNLAGGGMGAPGDMSGPPPPGPGERGWMDHMTDPTWKDFAIPGYGPFKQLFG